MPAGMEDNDFDDMVSFTFTAPDYNHALNESFSVDSIFEVLIMMSSQSFIFICEQFALADCMSVLLFSVFVLHFRLQ